MKRYIVTKPKLILSLALVLSGVLFNFFKASRCSGQTAAIVPAKPEAGAIRRESNTPSETTEMRAAAEFLLELKKQGNLLGVSKKSKVELTADRWFPGTPNGGVWLFKDRRVDVTTDDPPLSEVHEAKYPQVLVFHVVMIGNSFITNNYEVSRLSANTAWQLRAESPTPRLGFETLLDECSAKLGCHFTVEYRDFTITGKSSQESKVAIGWMVASPVRTDFRADSIPSLISNLRDYLDDFNVVRDSKNPGIVHIIEKVLADDPNYALNKKISVHYSGLLSHTNVPDPNRPGFQIEVGGLLAAVTEKVPDITEGAESAGGGGFGGSLPSDRITQVSINTTNETVRSIFTDSLPAVDYHAVMWTAVTTKRGNLNVLATPGSCVMVHFFGPKKP
jgi:hypothetical protein